MVFCCGQIVTCTDQRGHFSKSSPFRYQCCFPQGQWSLPVEQWSALCDNILIFLLETPGRSSILYCWVTCKPKPRTCPWPGSTHMTTKLVVGKLTHTSQQLLIMGNSRRVQLLPMRWIWEPKLWAEAAQLASTTQPPAQIQALFHSVRWQSLSWWLEFSQGACPDDTVPVYWGFSSSWWTYRKAFPCNPFGLSLAGSRRSKTRTKRQFMQGVNLV